jgi:hypothetical protein
MAATPKLDCPLSIAEDPWSVRRDVAQCRKPVVHRDRLGHAAAIMRDRRLADPERFGRIRVELGIGTQPEGKAAE